MREIRTLRSMSGDGKQGDAEWPLPLRPSSTLLTSFSGLRPHDNVSTRSCGHIGYPRPFRIRLAGSLTGRRWG